MVGTPTMSSEADSAGARGGAVRCKARRTDASSTPGRTIVRNGTDDEDFEDTLELAEQTSRKQWQCGRTPGAGGSGQRAAERIRGAREADEYTLIGIGSKVEEVFAINPAVTEWFKAAFEAMRSSMMGATADTRQPIPQT